jgi:hypothetical protein
MYVESIISNKFIQHKIIRIIVFVIVEGLVVLMESSWWFWFETQQLSSAISTFLSL